MSDDTPLFEVRNLKKYFSQNVSMMDTIMRRSGEPVQAVDDLSFTLQQNESIGVIGESGCGKTTLLMTLMGLHDVTDGEIRYKGKRTSEFSKKEWRSFRNSVQIIFQDPFNSLDPKLTVAESLKEPLKVHKMDDHDERIRTALEQVQLHPPEQYVHKLPRQLSGGEKQRVSIARAIIVEPDILLADEPVSMLDVSTQASVLNLLSDLIDELGVSLIYISHDLSTVSYVCDKIKVMYLGRVIEGSPTKELLEDPKHPYTQALISAVPIPDPHDDRNRTTLSGAPRDPIGMGEGCRFRDRCPERMDICDVTPAFVDVESGDRQVACHLYYDHEEYVGETEGSLDDAHAERGQEALDATD